MPPTVLQTARIFEDPEPPNTSRFHKRTTSVGDILRGRQREASPRKSNQPAPNNHASPSPLGERHINSPPQPKKVPLKGENESRPVMHKKTSSATSIKGFLMGREKSTEGQSPIKRAEDDFRKPKSSTNFAGLLKKRSKKDLKENEPVSTLPSPVLSTEPTFDSFWSNLSFQPPESQVVSYDIPAQDKKDTSIQGLKHGLGDDELPCSLEVRVGLQSDSDFKPPQRPFLEHKTSRSSIFTENLDDEEGLPTLQQSKNNEQSRSRPATPPHSPQKPQIRNELHSPEKFESKNRSSRIFETIATLNMRPWRSDATVTTQFPSSKESMSPHELDSAMENMLGRYDIPENLRDQLRNLKPEVKAGLMKGARIGSGSSIEGEDLRPSARRTDTECQPSNDEDSKEKKHSRSRSRPRSRILSLTKRGDQSPSKQEASGRSRSKSRPKSIDLTRPSSSSAMSSSLSLGSLKSPDSATTPGDFIHYLREVQKPELVEVGKVHKLRVLLRNESVAWTDAFVKKGGMDEVVNLLYRIMKLEWREEHEDTLLHHCLSCLKGLSTTSLAMQRLEALSAKLFPALLGMLFDPERKGPSEYSTRGVIISLVFTYLAATLHGNEVEHEKRAREILSFLKDPAPKGEKHMVEFVSQMHISRPYRIWCKEVNNVTKEVFWIFLHHMNVVPTLDVINKGETTFSCAYFPAARAPHPAAPYVGGVEWEATQYLANHLDLLNGIITALPSAEERNVLREDLRQSGWEKVMGCSLRTCKEKFYAGVHDGLRAWVAAAKQDGWYVEDVRAGPPREATSPRKSPIKKKSDEAPKIALDMSVPAVSTQNESWL